MLTLSHFPSVHLCTVTGCLGAFVVLQISWCSELAVCLKRKELHYGRFCVQNLFVVTVRELDFCSVHVSYICCIHKGIKLLLCSCVLDMHLKLPLYGHCL